MKTKVFMLLLKRLAKGLMSAEEYEAFSNRLNIMRWQQLRQQFPDVWEMFSGQLNEIKEQFTRNSDPENVLEAIVPGSIKHYPELFEPFRLQLEQIKSSFDLGAEAFTPAIDMSSDLANSGIDANVISDSINSAEVAASSVEISDVDGNTVSDLIDLIAAFFGDLFS